MTDNPISVYACATTKGTQVSHFLKSFSQFEGWDVHVVGMGLKWETFRTKMKCYRDALRHVNKKKVVVCLDAYDAVCFRDSAGFLDHFCAYRTPILVSYEPFCCFTLYNRFFQTGCCPNIDKWKNFHQVSLSDPIYVNSGCIIGYAGEIHKMFDWILNYKKFSIIDDQVGVGLYMNEFPEKVKLDLQDKLIFNDNFGERLQLQSLEDAQVLIGSPTRPYFLHFPGIKYRQEITNYETICSLLLDEDIPLHDTVKHNISSAYLPYITLVVVVVVVLFLVHRRKK
jgi:hypothetical protein